MFPFYVAPEQATGQTWQMKPKDYFLKSLRNQDKLRERMESPFLKVLKTPQRGWQRPVWRGPAPHACKTAPTWKLQDSTKILWRRPHFIHLNSIRQTPAEGS